MNKKKKEDDDLPNELESQLTELKGELIIYMSYLDVPDNSDDYYDF